MVILELTCPHCGAIIQVGDDSSAFCCPRCGSRIILDASKSTDSAAKTPDSEADDDSTLSANKKKRPLHNVISSIICVSVLACAGFSGYEWHCESEMKIAMQQIQESIDNKNFAGAKTDINALEYPGLLSSRKKNWHNQRDHLSIEVVKAEVRSLIENGDLVKASTELNSFMPADSCSAEWANTKTGLQEEINNKRREQEEQRQEEYKAKIRQCIDQGDYSGARSLLEEYLAPASVAQKWEKDKKILLEEITKKEEQAEHDRLIPIPFSSKEALEKSYSSLEKELKGAGFINVELKKTVPGNNIFSKVKHGQVKEITIVKDDNEIKGFKKDEPFKKSSKITIVYYDLTNIGMEKINAIKSKIKEFIPDNALIPSDSFNKARSELNSFVPPEYVSKEWDKIKEDLSNDISNKEKEVASLPLSSAEVSTFNHDDLKQCLEESGFKEIKFKEISKEAGNVFSKIKNIFSNYKRGDVVSIIIEMGGNSVTNFNKGDFLDKTASITITYYSERQ